MKKVGFVLCAAAVSLVAAAAAAQQPEAEKAERRICRSEMKTGSLVPRRRVCRTESQWREIHALDRDGVEVFKTRPNMACSYSTTSTSCQ